MVGNRFIFQLWKIQIGDIEINTSAYGLSGSFGSRLRSKYIGNKHIQAEEVISIQNQHQCMDSFKNIILTIHTVDVTSVGYHKHLLNN